MKKISIISMAASAIISFSACSNEELVEGMLPEGKYPLEIASVTMSVKNGEQPWMANAPQTRVTENADGMSSLWEGGEVFAAKPDATNEVGTFKMNADGTTTVETQTYWSKPTDNITAWYPAVSTIDLTDQSAGLAYMMKATALGVSYKTPVALNFTHQLAKVRVFLTGTYNMQGCIVQVKGYTTGTINNGAITGNNDGWITMKKCAYTDGTECYEANVIPGYTLSQGAFQVTPKNGTPTPLNLDAPISVSDGGKIHEITLMVNKNGTQEIDLTSSSDTGNQLQYNVGPNTSVILDGKGTLLNNKSVIINEGAHVALKNVKLQAPKTCTYVIEVKGNATITLTGENEIIGDATDVSCPIAVTGANATLTINGTVKDRLTLTTKSTYGVGLGAANKANLIINGGTIIANGGNGGAAIGGSGRLECGNIIINGGNITATGGENSAAIGAGVWEQGVADCVGKCGNITINGGKIYAKGNDNGYSAAGIGAGFMSTCGLISITGGNVTATAGIGEYGGAGIGSSVFGTAGDITITGGIITAIGKRGTTLESGTYNSGAGIGVGAAGKCGNINISGANTIVTATGGEGSDDIGYGFSPDPNQPSPSGTVTITSEAKVTATNGKIHGY